MAAAAINGDEDPFALAEALTLWDVSVEKLDLVLSFGDCCLEPIVAAAPRVPVEDFCFKKFLIGFRLRRGDIPSISGLADNGPVKGDDRGETGAALMGKFSEDVLVFILRGTGSGRCRWSESSETPRLCDLMKDLMMPSKKLRARYSYG